MSCAKYKATDSRFVIGESSNRKNGKNPVYLIIMCFGFCLNGRVYFFFLINDLSGNFRFL